MPKKWFKRVLPTAADLRQKKGLGFLGRLLDDPNLLHLNRQSVSTAFFIGVFSSFLPLPLQMAIAAGLAFLFRCNLPISMALVWISNPITWGPIFLFAYEVGRFLLGSPPVHVSFELTWDNFAQMNKILLPLWTGSILCGTFFGLCASVFMRWFWRWHVIRNWERRKNLRLLRKQTSPEHDTPTLKNTDSANDPDIDTKPPSQPGKRAD